MGCGGEAQGKGFLTQNTALRDAPPDAEKATARALTWFSLCNRTPGFPSSITRIDYISRRTFVTFT